METLSQTKLHEKNWVEPTEGEMITKASQPSFIAVSSQKGGVAKTTTCISLGACLAEMDLSVLMIDLDQQAHLTQWLGYAPDKVRRTIGDVLLQQASPLAVSRETMVPNLDIIPANNGLLLIDKLLYTIDGYEFRLRNLKEALRGNLYEFVLLDCPPTFGPLTINALTVSDLAIVPATCDFFSVRSLQNFLNLLALIRRKSNPSIDYRVLVTMFDARTRLSRMILEQYRQNYSDFMFSTVISLDVKLRESPLFSKPVTVYARNNRGAEDYRSLARELIKCLKKTK